MKRAVLDIDTSGILTRFPQFHLNELFEAIERLDVVEVLRLDFSKGVKILIVDLYLASNGKPLLLDQIQERMQTIARIVNGLKIIVLETALPKITCLLKMKYKQGLKILWSGFKLESFIDEISPDLPISMSKNKMILSFKGNEEAISKALKALSLLTKFKIISLDKASFGDTNVLNILTDQQRMVLLSAKNLGYYNYPRKINAEGLAAKLNLSKNTVIEHLRKAEVRLINQLLAGY